MYLNKEYLNTQGKAALWGDRFLNKVVAIILILAIFFCGYALFDAWRVLHGADSGNLMEYKPDETHPDLSALMAINPDVCAWLIIDDTNIDYPVVRGRDNEEYLDKDVYGDYSPSGSIFLDYRNSRNFDDKYSIVYGHRMYMGMMFSDIIKFSDYGYFNSHRTGTLMIPDKTMKLELFAYTVVDGYDGTIYSPISSAGDTGALLSYIRNRAIHYREISVSSEDRIIALSTCAENNINDRALVFAKIIP